METLGALSVIPPVLAIALALITRRVILSLSLGLLSGYIILAGGRGFWGRVAGLQDTALALIDVFKSSYNTKIIIFTLLVGILIALTQRSGGVAGFVDWLMNRLERADAKGRRVRVQLYALLLGTALFIESNISILTVGTIFRPVFDRVGIAREKLAYITDSSSAPSCILIPFNAWGAYIAGLLLAQNLEQPFGMVLKSVAYNIYPMATLIILAIVIVSGRDFGPMKTAERRVRETGQLLKDGARPMLSTQAEPADGTRPRARNMVIPIGVMVALMPAILVFTGRSAGGGLLTMLQNGDGASAVLWAVIGGIAAALILIAAQRRLTAGDIAKTSAVAAKGMLPLAALMVLAFALGTLCKALGTGDYVASLTAPYLSPALLPAIIFLTACFIAFSTGTSWGTFAIMIAIAVPLAQNMDANLPLAIAAALGGGVFGDHCSPTSDTSIITSMATANDHIDHVRTQLPYALLGGAITTGVYLVLGFAGA